MKQMSADYRGKNHRKKNLKHGLLKHGAHTNRSDDRSWRQNKGVEERALAAALEEAGLPGAIVTVEPVTELPRHPDTHKLKRFVPLS